MNIIIPQACFMQEDGQIYLSPETDTEYESVDILFDGFKVCIPLETLDDVIEALEKIKAYKSFKYICWI